MGKYDEISNQMALDFWELEQETIDNDRGIPNTFLGKKYDIDKSAAGEIWRGVRMGMLEESDDSKYGITVKKMYEDDIVSLNRQLTGLEIQDRFNIDSTAGTNMLRGLRSAKKVRISSNSRVFGSVGIIKPGQCFRNRNILSKAKVHRPTQKGISGSINEGADSIVLSGGYEDDLDYGNVIIYTGSGGRDSNSGEQIEDQKLEGDNLALAKSMLDGLDVRVIRGYNHKSPYSPKEGYIYSGLYKVTDYWSEIGKAGLKVWRYKLELIYEEVENTISPLSITNDNDFIQQTERIQITSNRIKRDINLANKIKKLYDNRCQVCGLALKTNIGTYSEAAHIKPLGQPHNGPDIASNILCLCPNHHKMFDYGGFSIDEDYSLIGIEGTLMMHPNHKVDREFIKYHSEHI